LAGRLGAAPSRLNFGGLVARLVRGRGKIVNRKSKIEIGMVRLPGIAPGRAPWQGAICC